MLAEALERGEAATLEVVSYLEDPTFSNVIRRGELVLEGSRYLDETDGWGEPIRQPPPGWTSVQSTRC